MRVLSIRNPLSYLVAAGIKRVENRTWTTKYRGRLLIHSCGNTSHFCMEDDYLPAAIIRQRDEDARNCIMTAMDKLTARLDKFYGCKSAAEFYALMDDHVKLRKIDPYMRPLAIIGETTLSDVVRDSPDPFAEPDMYHWILTDAKLYDYNDVIYPVKGKLGLWNFDRKE